MAELTQAIPTRTQATAYTSARRRPLTYYAGRVGFWLLIVAILLYTLFPFYWAVATSLKTSAELNQAPPLYWPKSFDLSHYDAVLHNGTFTAALKNSAIVAVASVLVALVIGSLAAYAIGRFNFRGKQPAMYLILSMTMFPAIAILGSLYDMIRLGGPVQHQAGPDLLLHDLHATLHGLGAREFLPGNAG